MDVDALLGQLHGLVSQLATADLGALDAGQLSRLVAGLQREQSRLTVAAAGPMHTWQAGGHWQSGRARTPSLALANPVRRCHHAVADELGRSAKLAGMPLVRAAVLAGRLSIDHVDLFCRHATARRWPYFVRDEALLVDACSAVPLFADAQRLVRYWADHVDDEIGASPDGSPSTLLASRCRDTGEVSLRGTLQPIDGEQVLRELDRLSREIRREDAAAGVRRTAAQVRAAALVRMAQRSAAAAGTGAGGARPLFQVIVGDATLSRLCELASGVVVRPQDLVPHLGAALVESFLFDEQHQLLGASRQRTFTGRLRRAIQVRDRRCQHTSGCPVPATDQLSDVDHVQPWAQGGTTAAGNGRVQCTAHNRLGALHGPPDRAGPPVEIGAGRASLERWRQQLRWRITHHVDD